MERKKEEMEGGREEESGNTGTGFKGLSTCIQVMESLE